MIPVLPVVPVVCVPVVPVLSDSRMSDRKRSAEEKLTADRVLIRSAVVGMQEASVVLARHTVSCVVVIL